MFFSLKRFFHYLQIASRTVFILAGVIMIICGVVGKVGAALAIIPSPIIGGTLLIGLALVVSIGVSVLSYCDMQSMRNLTVLGIAMLVGLMIPQWLADNPEKVDTGKALAIWNVLWWMWLAKQEKPTAAWYLECLMVVLDNKLWQFDSF